MTSDKNPYKKGGMFEGASFLLFEKARQLRNRIRENDITRQTDLEKMGYTIIRFSNDEIYKQINIVLAKISETVNHISKIKTSESEV